MNSYQHKYYFPVFKTKDNLGIKYLKFKFHHKCKYYSLSPMSYKGYRQNQNLCHNMQTNNYFSITYSIDNNHSRMHCKDFNLVQIQQMYMRNNYLLPNYILYIFYPEVCHSNSKSIEICIHFVAEILNQRNYYTRDYFFENYRNCKYCNLPNYRYMEHKL